MGVFSTAQERLSKHLGAAQPLESKNGVRFKHGSKGLATLYSRNLADGNLAELAVEVENLAALAGRPESEVKALIDRLRLETGLLVALNDRFKWPRVGLSKPEHVDLVVAAFSKLLPKAD